MKTKRYIVREPFKSFNGKFDWQDVKSFDTLSKARAFAKSLSKRINAITVIYDLDQEKLIERIGMENAGL